MLTEGAKIDKALYDTVRPPGVTDERIIGQEKKYAQQLIRSR